MRKLTLFILLSVFGLSNGLRATRNIPLVITSKKDIKKQQEKQEDETLKTRSIVPTDEQKIKHKLTGVTFGKSTYDKNNDVVFAGATANVGQNTSLLSFSLLRDGASAVAAILPLSAQGKVLLNGEEQNQNPFFQKTIKHLFFMGLYLGVVVNDAGNGEDKDIYFFDPLDLNKNIFKNAVTLKDAVGLGIGDIVALGGVGAVALAAVGANGTTWDNAAGVNRGFVVLKKEEKKLDLVEHDNGPLNNNPRVGARILDLQDPAQSPVLFNGATQLQAGAGVDIHYASRLGKFFIGLSGVAQNAGACGVTSIIIGEFDGDGKLKLSSLIPGVDQTVIADAANQIVGFFAAVPTVASTFKIRSMRTTTERDYLIAVGGVVAGNDDTALKNRVHALPLLPSDNVQAGRLAKADFSGIAAAAADIVKNDNPATVVGAGPTDSAISDIQVDGDTVYVSTDTGIYASTALFGADRAIFGWTQWQRVGGVKNKVLGFGFNNKTGNFSFLKEDPSLLPAAQTNIFGITAWGTSENVRRGPQEFRGLTGALATIFPAEKGGMYDIFDFSKNTPGLNNSSMMVAVGNHSVAIIKTDVADAADAANWGLGRNIFVLTGDADILAKVNASAPGSAVDNPALKEIGPLKTAELSRSAAGNHLYVGGCNGLAVNSGWNDFAGIRAIQFAQVEDYGIVCNISSDGQNVYVSGPDELIRVGLDAARTDVIASFENIEYGSDVLSIPRWNGVNRDPAGALIAATTKGLLVSLDPQMGEFYTVKNIEGLPVKLVYVQVKKDAIASDQTKGMLFVLTIDRNRRTSYVYRFAVNVDLANTAEQILTPLDVIEGTTLPLPFIDYGQVRTDFSTDGSIFFNTRMRNSEKFDYLRMRTGEYYHQHDYSLHNLLSRDECEGSAYIAAPVKDSESGMWFVPGEVRVNG